MRKWLIGLWLLIVPAFGLWHLFGQGENYLNNDRVASHLKEADRALAAEQWDKAIEAYDAALGMLPDERADEKRRIRLAKANVKLRGETFSKGREDLVDIVNELEAIPDRDPEALKSARASLAYSRFYTSWLMRLEGRNRQEWEPEVEAARQWFRVSAEQALRQGDHSSLDRFQKDLESSVRLARLDLTDLQAINLPEELQNGQSSDQDGEGKKGQTGKGKGKNKGQGEEGSEEGLGQEGKKTQDARGASAGPPPDTGGH